MTHTIFVLYNNNGKLGIKWNYQFLSEEFQEGIKAINLIYDKGYLLWLADNRKKVKPRQNRTCKFCGKSFPDVKFSHLTHKIPEFMGNKYHLSDFECDNCNSKFSLYENDLANYLGLYRTIAEIIGKKGVPKYKSRDKAMSIEQAFKNALDVRVNKLNNINNIFTYADGGGFRIKSQGDPYIPINAFKCLLKSAISFVFEDDLKFLSKSIKFLNEDEYVPDQANDFIFTIHQYFVPGNFTNTPPFIIHYKKGIKFINYPSPSLIFIFYIKNLILQMFIPFHDKDTFIYNSNLERKLFIVPPLINNDWFKKYGGPFSRLMNLNNSNVIKENMQVIDWKSTK